MEKTKYCLKSIAALAITLIALASCENDFSTIESDVQGVKNFESKDQFLPMTAKTKLVTPFTTNGTDDMVGVQTNNTNGILLGVYKDPNNVFGTTAASFVSQVTPSTYDPDFGTNPTIKSAVLNIPYFSTLTNSTDDSNTYELDSIYGNQDKTYKLSIYRNNYLLRDLDPETNFESQAYYSNQQDVFDNATSDADLIYEDDAFKPSNLETTIEGEDSVPPSLRATLKSEFFTNLLFENATASDLSSKDAFVNYFRGLIFKIEANNDDGAICYLNINAGNISVEYTNDEDTETAKTYNLIFSGQKLNTFNTTGSTDVDNKEDNLYLKGGDGAFATIDLFAGDDLDGNGLSDIEDNFRSKKDKWLINEANLVFYVNQELVNGDEPERVILYDLKNNVPIQDYFSDNSSDKAIWSEPLERDANGNGVSYTFKITNHINNILQNDEENVKLGLYLVNTITQIVGVTSKIQGANSDEDDTTINAVPPASVLSPKGTILYGSDKSTSAKPAEFQIFYTDTEN